MNNKGNIGMSFIIGIMTAVISLVFFMALTPVITSSFGIARGSNGANCAGYIDPAGQNSYNVSLGTDTLTCTVTSFGTGMIVMAVVFGIIAGILSGKFGQESQQQPMYQGGYYPGG